MACALHTPRAGESVFLQLGPWTPAGDLAAPRFASTSISAGTRLNDANYLILCCFKDGSRPFSSGKSLLAYAALCCPHRVRSAERVVQVSPDGSNPGGGIEVVIPESSTQMTGLKAIYGAARINELHGFRA